MIVKIFILNRDCLFATKKSKIYSIWNLSDVNDFIDEDKFDQKFNP